MSKTHISITDNPKLLVVPEKWTLHVTDIALSNGANLIVVYCDKVFTMPGLPKRKT
jgi:formate--tetrahydrofolate ligase